MTERFWSRLPVLITGATGLVGGHVVDALLKRDASITALVRDFVPFSRFYSEGMSQRCNCVEGSVTDQALLERVIGENEIAVVLHLAAQTIVPTAHKNPVSTWDTNIRGSYALLEACRRSPGVQSVVFASSDKAYGAADVLPYSEATPLRPTAPYDVSKAAGDMIAASYAKTWDVPVAVTRCGNFYGGGDLNFSRIVPGTIRSLLARERIVMRSNGSPIRDYFYVEDGAEAYLALAEALARDPKKFRGEAFNFSNDHPVSARALIEQIDRAVGNDPSTVAERILVANTATGEIDAQHLSSAKAREWIGWAPRFSLDDGLARTLAWYRGFFGDRST